MPRRLRGHRQGQKGRAIPIEPTPEALTTVTSSRGSGAAALTGSRIPPPAVRPHVGNAVGARRDRSHAPSEQQRRISLLAAAVPFAANLDVAVHTLHVRPPATTGADLQLTDRIRKDAATAINLCERALELDGASHDYQLAECRPVIDDIVTEITTTARVDREPPSLVSCARYCVTWLARAIADLDHDHPDAAAAIAGAIGRLLALWQFAGAATMVAATLDPDQPRSHPHRQG